MHYDLGGWQKTSCEMAGNDMLFGVHSHEINFSSDYTFPPESAFVFKQRSHYAQA